MAKWALGLVANPYHEVCLVELDESGAVAWRRVRNWTGKWDDKGQPIYKGWTRVVTTSTPHSSGGNFSASSVGVIDPTPRDADEAMAIASRCRRGNHLCMMTDAEAREQIAAAIEALGVAAR